MDDQFVTTCLLIYHWSVDNNFVTGVGIYKRKILRQKERKHAFDQEKKLDSRKKERKHVFDQEKRKKQERRKKTSFRPFFNNLQVCDY